MHNTINFTYTSTIDYVYDTDGHRHVKVPIFFDKKSYSNYAVDFIFDTGAYIDSKNDKIHFAENFNYKPPAELKSGRVYSVSP